MFWKKRKYFKMSSIEFLPSVLGVKKVIDKDIQIVIEILYLAKIKCWSKMKCSLILPIFIYGIHVHIY